MEKVRDNIWHIENEEDLFENSDAAQSLIGFAEAEGKRDGVRWFFQDGYADFVNNEVTGIFGSYLTDEYKGYTLSILAKKTNEGSWECVVRKKEVPGSLA